jgi:hypothetical protein
MNGHGHRRVEAGRCGAEAVGAEASEGAAQGPSDGREVALASEEVAEGIGGAGAGKTPDGADEGFEGAGAALVREATEEGVEGVVGGERSEGRGGAAAEPLVGVVQGGVEVGPGGVVAGSAKGLGGLAARVFVAAAQREAEREHVDGLRGAGGLLRGHREGVSQWRRGLHARGREG